jgi:hypothetical protein
MTAIITDLTLPSGVQVSGQAITGSISFNGTTQFLSTTTSGVDTTNSTPLGGSIALNGAAGSYVTYSTGSSFDLGTGSPNYTVECWFYVNPGAFSSRRPIVNSGWIENITNSCYGFVIYENSNQVSWITSNGGAGGLSQYFVLSAAISPNTWYHIASVKQGNTIGYYLNGILLKSGTLTFSVGASTDLAVGTQSLSTPYGFFSGYINNVRIVKGQAVYPCSFTPPTTPLTAVTGTSLLLDVASSGAYLTDSSPNNYTVTNTGGVTYSASTPVSSGGSLSFNGSSNYISTNGAALPTGTSDFTLEFYTYQTSFTYGNYPRLVQGAGTGVLQIYMSGGTLYVGGDGAFGFCSYGIGAAGLGSTWVHIAVTRTNGRVYLWINGVAVSVAPDASLTYSLSASSTLNIFQPEGGGPVGLMTNFRIVKGTAIYNANFTPSIFPLPSTQAANIYGNPSTAITGSQTSLLLNAPIGASFLSDGSSFNHTPTNGGAAASSSFTTFNSIPFTVELWWKSSGAGQANGKIFQTADGDSYTSVSLTLDGTGNNLLVYMSNTGQSWNLVNGTSFTLTTGTWYHLALVYNGTTIKLYVNGTGTTLATVSTIINPVGTTVIGGQTNGKNAYGLISNVRVMNGVAVYTSNFTPPSGPLSITQYANQNGNPSNATNNITSTNLMLNTVNDSSYLTDSSYYKNTITANASPSSSASNPF